MTNDVWADPVPEAHDPCNRRCGVSSITGLCSGCFRTLDEIANWERMDKEDQIEVLKEVEKRRAR